LKEVAAVVSKKLVLLERSATSCCCWRGRGCRRRGRECCCYNDFCEYNAIKEASQLKRLRC